MALVSVKVPNEEGCECPILPIPPEKIVTSFQEMYDFFLSGITDDMFLEMTKEDTEQVLEEILIAALPHFEFPR